MKLKIEISPEAQEEVVIRCNEQNEKILHLQQVIENLINADAEMILHIKDTEYFVPYKKILFFEIQNGKVTAHTKERMLTTEHTLAKLEEILPSYFIRGSKSCIINSSLVSAIAHNIYGPSKVFFKGSEKIVYVSRAYYKFLKEKICSLRGI